MEEKVLLQTGRGLKRKESQNRLQSNIDNIHLTSPWVGAWRGGQLVKHCLHLVTAVIIEKHQRLLHQVKSQLKKTKAKRCHYFKSVLLQEHCGQEMKEKHFPWFFFYFFSLLFFSACCRWWWFKQREEEKWSKKKGRHMWCDQRETKVKGVKEEQLFIFKSSL